MHLYVMCVCVCSDAWHIFCSLCVCVFCAHCPSNRTKSNQRWMKLRTTVQISSAIQSKKPPLKREDSFLKRFSTRQIPETQVSQFNHPSEFTESIDICVLNTNEQRNGVHIIAGNTPLPKFHKLNIRGIDFHY